MFLCENIQMKCYKLLSFKSRERQRAEKELDFSSFLKNY